MQVPIHRIGRKAEPCHNLRNRKNLTVRCVGLYQYCI
jgi:hypothetical protein